MILKLAHYVESVLELKLDVKSIPMIKAAFLVYYKHLKPALDMNAMTLKTDRLRMFEIRSELTAPL